MFDVAEVVVYLHIRLSLYQSAAAVKPPRLQICFPQTQQSSLGNRALIHVLYRLRYILLLCSIEKKNVLATGQWHSRRKCNVCLIWFLKCVVGLQIPRWRPTRTQHGHFCITCCTASGFAANDHMTADVDLFCVAAAARATRQECLCECVSVVWLFVATLEPRDRPFDVKNHTFFCFCFWFL